MRSEPVESLFAPPESEPMTTTKTARDMRNAGRPFSNRADCLALREVVPADFISCAAFAARTVRLTITATAFNARAMKCTFSMWSVHGYTEYAQPKHIRESRQEIRIASLYLALYGPASTSTPPSDALRIRTRSTPSSHRRLRRRSRAELKMTGRTSHRLGVALVVFFFFWCSISLFDSFRPGLVKAQISMTTLYRSPRQK